MTAQMFPAFFSAMDDSRLRGTPHRLYLFLVKRLDFGSRYREVKIESLASEAAIRRSSIQDALDTLIVLGYIERGPKIGKVNSYCLVWSLETESFPAVSTPSAEQASPKSA